MKKRIFSLALVMMLVMSVGVFADDAPKMEDKAKAEVVHYQVPVELKKYGEDKASMANTSLGKVADVEVKDGKYTYHIYTSNMYLMGAEDGLNKLFVYDAGVDGEKKEAMKSEVAEPKMNKMTVKIDGKDVEKEYALKDKFTFTRDMADEKEIHVAVWVDAMDQLAGGKAGDGEQDATLFVDWDKATKVEQKEEPKADDKKMDDKKEEPKADDKKMEDKKEEPKADDKKEEPKADDKKEEPKEEVKAPTFSDVKEADWFAKAVNFATSEGLFKGMPDGTFAPAGKLTRAQFVTVLGRKAGVEKTNEGQWYDAYMNWSIENKLVDNKTVENFMPNEELSRAEMAFILDNFLTLTKVELDDVKAVEFTDLSDKTYPESVNRLAKKGVVNGKGEGKFEPNATLTRAETAQVLFNIYAPKAEDK